MQNYKQVLNLTEQGMSRDIIETLTGNTGEQLDLILANIELENKMKVQGFDRYMERQNNLDSRGKQMDTDNAMHKINKMLKPMMKDIKQYVEDNAHKKNKGIVYKVFTQYAPDYLALTTLRTCMLAITTQRNELAACTTRLTDFLLDTELTTSEAMRVGMKLIRIFCNNSDECFELVKRSNGSNAIHMIEATEKFTEWETEHREYLAEMSVVYRPMIVPPKPWTGLNSGGYWDDKLSQKFVRHNKKVNNRTHGYKAIPRVYQAVNKIQATPFAINTFVLDVANELYDDSLDYLEDISRDYDNVPNCFFPKFMQALPQKPYNERVRDLQKKQAKLEEKLGITAESRTEQGKGFGQWVRNLLERITDGKQYKIKQQLEEVRFKIMQLVKWQKEVQSRTSKNRIISIALEVANAYKQYPAIYFPCNLDWRGRVYPMPAGLTTQGVNLQKALLKFNKGKPIGTEEALYWLMVHTANTFGKDKASWHDRIEWTLANEELIKRVASDPLGNLEDWRNTDEPWLFLAACEQMAKYYKDGLNAVVDIPIPMDGTCNGAQHYAAMSRDIGGAYGVNVAPNGTQGLKDRLKERRQALNISNPTCPIWEDGKKYLSTEINRKLKNLIGVNND